jgi:hypothetical protein
VIAGSVSLRADALDFLGDAANYAVALTVVFGRQTARDAGAAHFPQRLPDNPHRRWLHGDDLISE